MCSNIWLVWKIFFHLICIFFWAGDQIPSHGDQLLSFPVLFLPYQQTESALNVDHLGYLLQNSGIGAG